MNIHPLPNIGILEHKFTLAELEPIWDEVNSIQTNPTLAEKFNHGLVGNIKREFRLQSCSQHLDTLLVPLINKYEESFGYLSSLQVNSNLARVKQSTAWVNFMQANEFNPLHNHRGVLSYVIWLQVPYDPKDEASYYPDSVDKTAGGSFELIYPSITGKLSTYRKVLDHTSQGEMILFPASMHHVVYPFRTSSTQDRISVAGNFVFDID